MQIYYAFDEFDTEGAESWISDALYFLISKWCIVEFPYL